MAKELQVLHTTAKTVYFQLFNSVGQIRDVVAAAWDTYATADIGDYDIAATEAGTASGYYTADFPASVSAGVYSAVARERAGGSPAETDIAVGIGLLEWDGTAVVPLYNVPSNMIQLNSSATAAARLSQMFAATRLITVDDATFTPTTTAFETDQTTDDSARYSEQVLFGLDGNNTGFAVRITGYAFTSSKVKLTVDTLPAAPSDNHRFILMGRIEQ